MVSGETIEQTKVIDIGDLQTLVPTLRVTPLQRSTNINLFANAATGFKASSWKLSRDTRPFPEDQAAIEAAGLAQNNQSYGGRYASPEESTVYELGMKARFEKVALNVTIFDQTIEGFHPQFL